MNASSITASVLMLLASLPGQAQTEWRIRSSPTQNSITSVVFGNGAFLACDGSPLRSEDGINWTKPQWPAGPVKSVFFGGGEFIAFGCNPQTGGGYFWRSKDGISATRHSAPAAWGNFRLEYTNVSAARINGSWFLCGPSVPPAIIYSNSYMETTRESPWSSPPNWVINYEGKLISGVNGALFESTDPSVWSLLSRDRLIATKPTQAGGSLLSQYCKSDDGGKTWREWSNDWADQVIFERGMFIGCGSTFYPEGTFIKTSTDGKNWTRRETGTTSSLNSIAFGNNVFVSVGGEGRIITSLPENEQPPVVAPQLKIVPSMMVKWPSTAGLYYQPETSSDMKAWAAFGDTIPGTGSEIARSFEITEQRKYFRVTVR